MPSTVGGNPQGISKHLNELGVKSETWALTQNYFQYNTDKVVCKETDGVCVREIKRLLALRYIFHADVVFFNFGGGLFRPFISFDSKKFCGFRKYLYRIYAVYSRVFATLEVSFIKLLKKPIFIQYQGSDARQGDYCKEHFTVNYVNRVEAERFNKIADDARRNAICFYAKKSSKIYALNPDLLHVLPEVAEFLPYSHISLNEWLPRFTQTTDRPLRIAHAPSSRAVKGTDLILQAAQGLKSAGYEFELVLIEGLSNAEAREAYETIDVLIDQLFAGWYGGLAVEAMALGKPVVAYIREGDLRFIPAQMKVDLPIIQTEPCEIGEVLKSVLAMPRTDLLEIARKSRAYVEKWHNPIIVAERIRGDMEAALIEECSG